METVTDFIFLGFKITADGDCSHEIKRCFLLERKAMTNLDSILKSRDIITDQLFQIHSFLCLMFFFIGYLLLPWVDYNMLLYFKVKVVLFPSKKQQPDLCTSPDKKMHRHW